MDSTYKYKCHVTPILPSNVTSIEGRKRVIQKSGGCINDIQWLLHVLHIAKTRFFTLSIMCCTSFSFFSSQDHTRCIPCRMVRKNDEDSFDLESSLEVLMISSPNRDDLVFPKGGWEDDETVKEAACREALEEAGVKGIIKGDSLGDWSFRSKSRQESGCLEGGCKVCMFALEVTEELDAWPEQENHERKWPIVYKGCIPVVPLPVDEHSPGKVSTSNGYRKQTRGKPKFSGLAPNSSFRRKQ